MKFLGLIPSRYNSTRLPGKPLANIGGKSMIQRVFEQACLSQNLDKVVVATDDERIYRHALDFGGNAIMTSPDHLNGTERCAEVAAELDCDYVINIQGDEPFIHPDQIDTLCELMPETQIGTLARKIESADELIADSVIKVAFNDAWQAIYFSRSPIPYLRGYDISSWLSKATFFRHIGIYGFERDILLKITKLPPSRLELSESLEQLRWLENGFKIKLALTKYDSFGIDTPEDLKRSIEWI